MGPDQSSYSNFNWLKLNYCASVELHTFILKKNLQTSPLNVPFELPYHYKQSSEFILIFHNVLTKYCNLKWSNACNFNITG